MANSTTVNFYSKFYDPGVNDIVNHFWEVATSGANGTFDYSQVPGLFSGQVLNLGLIVDDGDGGFDTHDFTLTIENVPVPELTGFTLAGLAAAPFAWFRRKCSRHAGYPLGHAVRGIRKR